jgi:hypothetical protein
MADVKPGLTRQRKDGKLVREYCVLWCEPMRDEFGVQRRGQYPPAVRHTRQEPMQTPAAMN